MKLVMDETHSSALRRWAVSHEGRLVGSDILRTEMMRAARRVAPGRMVRARAVLDSIELLRVSTPTFQRAEGIEPTLLRSLDALHLAAAMELGDDLDGIVTSAERLAEAAEANGITTISPR